MQKQGTIVLLCGIRPSFAKAMTNLRFQDWLPTDRIFLEEDERYSATLKAVRHVHTLHPNNPCPHYQQNGTTAPGRQAQYYLV